MYIYTDMLKNVLSQLESKEMPPEDEPMSDTDRKVLVDWLKSTFKRLETTASNNPGPTRIRRLTGKEYNNTVKQLTGLDLDLAKNFPTDGGGGEGFSNDSSILGISPLQFEKYLEAAQVISSYSKFDIKKGVTFTQSAHVVSSREDAIKKIEKDIQKLLGNLYPPNFTYESGLKSMMQLTLQYNKTRDVKALQKAAAAKKLNFIMVKKAINYFSSSTNKTVMERDSLRDWFNLKRLKYEDKAAQKSMAQYLKTYKEEMGKISSAKGVQKRTLQLFESNVKKIFTLTEKELMTVVNKDKLAEYQKLNRTLDVLNKGMASKYRGLFAKDIMPHISKFLEKTYRMPPDPKEVNEVTKDFINASAKFGIPMASRLMVIRAYVSMKFIFRVERKIGKPTKISDYELANRLAYFIWSSPPDATLLRLAEQNKLNDKMTLLTQVKRMMKDPKSRALSDNFAAEWLHFGEILENETPDEKKFPSYNKNLAKDMYEESARFFDHIVKGDRSVLEIIDADYTFLNGRMKQHYGLGSGSSGFSKVSLRDKKRGGIITHASVLTLTSHPLRTSPVIRGTWVLSNLLGTPPPPPPPNVPALPDEEKTTAKLTLKQQLAEHRKSPRCNGCHLRIDPVGFPLENYDPIGRWRDKYEKASIDDSGNFKGGIEVKGPEGLKKYLMDRKEDFLRNMSRKMFGYALGRGIAYYDYYEISKMVENLKRNNYRISALVASIVLSYQFQHKN